MKWLNLLCKICAIFAQFFWQTFALFLHMKHNEFCAKPEIFLRKLRMKLNFSFAQNRKFYAKCNFLGKLSKIDILSLELNN